MDTKKVSYDEKTEEAHQRWNKMAPTFASRLEPYTFQSALTNFEKCLSLRPPGAEKLRIIEIGCGSGVLGQAIIEAHGAVIEEYLFVDIAEVMLDLAQQRLADLLKTSAVKASFLARSADDLADIPSNHFDIALSFFCVHLTVHPDRTMTEAKRVLKPQGRLVATVPGHYDASPLHAIAFNILKEKNLFDPNSKGLAFYWLSNRQVFSELGQVAGFEIVTVYDYFHHMKVTPGFADDFIDLFKSVALTAISGEDLELLKREYQQRLEAACDENNTVQLLGICGIFKKLQ